MRTGPTLKAALAALSIAVCAQPACAAPRATVFYNGKVVTVRAAGDVQTAFAVRGDRFIAVGSDKAVSDKAGPGARRVNLDGAAVIPGLSDSHDHLWNTSKYLYRGVDMVGVTSLDEMQRRLRIAVGQAKPGSVVFTTLGWTLPSPLTRADLDQISADVPIAVIASRRGVAMFNSAALRKVGVSKAHPTFDGVATPVDATGEPTGAMPGYPTSVLMVDALLPPITAADADAMVKKAMQERNALGVTSVRELALWPQGVQALARMARQHKLTVRFAVGVEFPDQARTAEHLAALGSPKRTDPWFFLDSSGEEPWTPGTMPTEPYTQLVEAENRLDWRPAPHANADVLRGISADQAADATLDAYEAADRQGPLDGKRWYLEHVPFATPAQIERMARLGLVISTQDAGRVVPAKAPLPPDRMARQNPIRDFLDHRLIVIGGSDYGGPTPAEAEPNNPLIPFQFYVTRKTQGGDMATPSQIVSREQALRIFTANAAYATFEEKRKGVIAPGMLADFVILNQDLMTVPDDQILATRPLATFVGGKAVYTAPGRRF